MIRYILNHWKLLLHMAFTTRHFGVNNRWWSATPSVFGKPWYRILADTLLLLPIIRMVQAAIMRSRCGWLPNDARRYQTRNKTP